MNFACGGRLHAKLNRRRERSNTTMAANMSIWIVHSDIERSPDRAQRPGAAHEETRPCACERALGGRLESLGLEFIRVAGPWPNTRLSGVLRFSFAPSWTLKEIHPRFLFTDSFFCVPCRYIVLSKVHTTDAARIRIVYRFVVCFSPPRGWGVKTKIRPPLF